MRMHEDMQHEEFAQVLSKAHLRRSADIGAWLRQLLERRRQSKEQRGKALHHGRVPRPYLIAAFWSGSGRK
ncbi:MULTISPECIES: hypothetical protein [Bradyrhizobium]|uniref:hypothetical protein n=1 Tax=Bradyrhizobium TaxID=374 RepID=UPI002167F5A0|nr:MULTISPECIES: hypothetical protein [Bradyrhizobium]MCS3966782.1 hypothetical protein [Bradyrhizobium japonicum]